MTENHYPPPPPYAPDPDLICWIEDPWHGPSRPKTWRCWLGWWWPWTRWHKCEHRLAVEARERAADD